MDSVREIALIFCSVSVLTAALSLLSGNALNKSMKYITALILLCSVVGGISETVFDLDFNIDVSAETSTGTALSLSEYQAEVLIEQILKESTVEFSNISARATKMEDGGIIISEVTIKGVDNRDAAKTALEERGIDCMVIFE